MRTRGLIRLLSEELFGASLPLTEFPRARSLRGLGTSDSDSYADRLADRFDYRNTFLHREPRFDIARPSSADFDRYDFLLSSEVMEHVVAPVEQAFQNACRLLKPTGVFVFTVPYSLDAATREHFGELQDFGLAQLSDRTLLVNRTPEGDVRVFDNLVFHGGDGSTLEMREFSEAGLKGLLAAAGFTEVRFDSRDYPEFGIVRRGSWSLPISARKAPYGLARDTVGELVGQYRDSQKRLEALMSSPLVRLACKLRLL